MRNTVRRRQADLQEHWLRYAATPLQHQLLGARKFVHFEVELQTKQMDFLTTAVLPTVANTLFWGLILIHGTCSLPWRKCDAKLLYPHQVRAKKRQFDTQQSEGRAHALMRKAVRGICRSVTPYGNDKCTSRRTQHFFGALSSVGDCEPW